MAKRKRCRYNTTCLIIAKTEFDFNFGNDAKFFAEVIFSFNDIWLGISNSFPLIINPKGIFLNKD